jgi:hypothetical protein
LLPSRLGVLGILGNFDQNEVQATDQEEPTLRAKTWA